MEIKSREILDILAELGWPAARRTPVAEGYEADKCGRIVVAAEPTLRSVACPQGITPKIDLSNVSKPGM